MNETNIEEAQTSAEVAPELQAESAVPAQLAEEAAAEPEVDLDALIEEAERRGYLRGRNEAIGQVKRRLARWEVPRVEQPDTATSTPTILANLPTSIWDR